MRLDNRLIELLLLELEGEEKVDLSSYTEDQIGHHKYRVFERGLAKGADMTAGADPFSTALLTELTSAGHDELDRIRQVRAQEGKVLDGVRLAETVNKMRRHFSSDELQDLCLGLSVDIKDLSGESPSARFGSLALHMDRHGRLDELITLCRKMRPRVEW